VIQHIWAFLRAFWRSFFLQTLWNFERMQNVGFAYTIDPLLRLAHSARPTYLAALRRHMGFFNVHPYLASIVIGSIYEREKAAGEKESAAKTLVVLKDSMGGAFGAIGDHVLWGTWRPFCAVLAMSAGLMLAYPVSEQGLVHSLFHTPAARICAIWWVLGFFGLFNFVHLWLRWRGLQKSMVMGPAVVQWLQSLKLQPWASQIRRLGLLIVAIMILIYLSRWGSSQMMIWMVAVLLGTMVLRRWNTSGWMLFYLVGGASALMTKFGVTWP